MAEESGAAQRVDLLVRMTLVRPRILRFCHARLGPEDAEDACQEVYLELLAHSDRLLAHPNPIGWLFVTARNKCHEALRRRKPGVELSEMADPGSPDVLDLLVDLEGPSALLDRLPPQLREITELRCQGYSSREIGELVEPPISENAVNMKLYRIRQILRPFLRGEDGQ